MTMTSSSMPGALRLLLRLCIIVQSASANSNSNHNDNSSHSYAPSRIRNLQNAALQGASEQNQTTNADAAVAAFNSITDLLSQAQATPAVSQEQTQIITTPSPTPPPQSLGVSVGGVVYYDINANGLREPNEPGVPSVTIQIRSCTNARFGSVRTNSDGEFEAILENPGCYQARLDVTSLTFAQGGDVNPISGRTEGVTLEDGQARYWYAGLVAPEGMTASPTLEPTQTVTDVPSMIPSEAPTDAPTRPPVPTHSPTISTAPSAIPTTSTPPTECLKEDRVQKDLLSSSPIMRASYGIIFSLSTPENPDKSKRDGLFDDEEETEYVKLTSISLRVKSPILNPASSTDYQVWSRQGNYRGTDEEGQEYDGRGNFIGWTLTADGNSLGATTAIMKDIDVDDEVTNATSIGDNSTESTDQQAQQNVAIQEEPLILDPDFFSSAYPSDKDKYPDSPPSSPLSDGGIETISPDGEPITSYLYKIPTSIFKPVMIPKYGGKVSFYVTLDRALLQFGSATENEWDNIDLEDGEYDIENDDRDMNVRIHVGESVTSNPWTDIGKFYSPRRFLGKVWYEQTKIVPCHLYIGAPSMAPSELYIPPLPKNETAKELGAEGEDIETSFVVSVYLQQNINEATRMSAQVKKAFRQTMLDFLNEEYTLEHCMWCTSLEVAFQKLSLLEGVRDRQRFLRGKTQQKRWQNDSRRTQTEITVLQVEISLQGVAYNHEGICPAGSTPATATSRGKNWDETMESIGIDLIMDNPDTLGELLKDTHEYFDNTFLVDAKPDLLQQRPDAETPDGVVTNSTVTEEEKSLLIPIIAAVVAAAVLLCLIGCFCFYRKKKQQQKQDAEGAKTEEASEIPKEIKIMDDSEHKQEEAGMEQAPDGGTMDQDITEGESETLSPEEPDPLMEAWPTLGSVPRLEEIVMMRGLPRRRSNPKLVTLTSVSHKAIRRNRSISCLREVWTNLNKEDSYANAQAVLMGSYMDELLKGTLYPVEDADVLEWERRHHLAGDDADAPYVPHGGHLEHNFIDDAEAERIELANLEARKEEEVRLAEERVKNAPKPNPLVMQQVEMLEAKWKQLKTEYGDGDESDSDSDEDVLRGFDVNMRIEQLMTHIEKLEMERKLKLAELKRQEHEEEGLARKRMVKGGDGINYNDEFNKDFVIRRKKKKSKSRKIIEESESESSSDEEESYVDEFDVKWMRLKVPLAHQDPDAMKDMVDKGNEL